MRKNRKAIRELADFIETADYTFDMEQTQADPPCGSAGCIGGHAAALWEEVRYEGWEDNIPGFSWDERRLGEKLGITNEQQDSLCFTAPTEIGERSLRLDRVTREMAVDALRRLANTGEVFFVVGE